MTQIPEPPDSVKNGNGAVEIWKAIFENRELFLVAIAGVKAEMRYLGIVVMVLLSAIVGHTLLT